MIAQDIINQYQPVIGLEVHAQLLTESKIYAPDSTAYGSLPNTNISVITLGHPGTMPKLNKKVVELALKMGLACHCDITRENIFDRKNYFYPDLPKGYQITQDKTPICRHGSVAIKLKDGTKKEIGLTRIHIEEDAGKSIHLDGEIDTLVDFNRAGVPLIEIVTEPVIRSSEEAYAFLTEVRKLVRYLEICDGNMEEGSLRCDANISVMRKEADKFGNKVEVKNMNSIRNVQRAIEHEIIRQIEVLENGGTIPSETRNFDAVTGLTSGMRTKEELNDYRYFPEPDLSPLLISEDWIEEIKAEMPPLPNELFEKFVNEYKLPEYDAGVLTDSKEIALYFEELCQKTTNYKAASNWVMGPVKSYLNELTMHIDDYPIKTSSIAEIISLIEEGKLNFSVASQKVYPELLKNPGFSVMEIAEKMNVIQDSNQDAILPLIEEVLNQFPEKVAQYKGGKKGLLGLFMGEVMKKSKGKADPKKTNELIRKALDE
jgi:aspartyl-tRNA(Asn)/glutamyl-tRNA(Gln) amidotransferase subunit B